jgi:hypothetical protein
MADVVVLKCSGLNTDPNNLGSVPNGSLEQADNVYISRPDIAEPRRGFKVYGDSLGISTDRAKQLLQYKEQILRHYGSVLQRDNGSGTFTSYSEAVNEVETGVKIKAVEQNGNLYITSAQGVRKLDSLTSPITLAGGVKALDVEASLVDAEGFFNQDSQVAYRVLWGYKDLNNNVIYGTPSQRAIVINSILNLLTSDVNKATQRLDLDTGVTDTNYNSLYAFDGSETESQAYAKLKNLAAKLNKDAGVISTDIAASGKQNETTIVCGAASTLTTGDHFYINSADDETKYYVWYNKDGGGGDPALLGYTGIQVSVVTADTNIQVATATAAAINAAADFVAESSSFTVITRNVREGACAETVDDTTNGTGFAFTTTQSGSTIDAPDYLQVQQAFDNIIDKLNVDGEIEETTVNFVAGNLYVTTGTADYFDIYSPNSTQIPASGNDLYRVWFNIGTVTAPSGGAGITLVPVILVGTETDVQVAEKVAAALEAYSFVIGTIANPMIIQAPKTGTATNATETVSDAGFTVTTTTSGTGASYLYQNSTQSQQVSLTFTIPSDIINAATPTDFFYQLYRSSLSIAGDVSPDDNLQLVYEANPTGAEITAKLVTVIDITPDSFRGANLYTNPNQEGIVQSNERPPLARDIASYKNSLFYANTSSVQRKELSMLSISDLKPANGPVEAYSASLPDTVIIVSANHGLATGNSITISGSTEALLNNTFTVTVIDDTTFSILLSGVATDGDTGTWSRNTAGYSVLTFKSGVSQFNIKFGNTEDITNGVVKLSTLETPAQQVDETAKNLCKVMNRFTSNTFLNAFYISGVDDLPGKLLFEARTLSVAQFGIGAESSGVGFTGNQFSPTVPVFPFTTDSDNQVNPNRVYYSKFQQPEAVPALNYLEVGGKDSPIKRIVALRDSLFVFKTDGIYRISGNDITSLNLQLFDNSLHILAPETAAVGDNQIFVVTDQGIVNVSDVGIKALDLNKIADTKVKPILNYSNLETYGFGFFYQTENQYYCWLPSTATDTSATQCYVYNTNTEAWTRLPIAKTCGIVSETTNRVYLGAADINNIEVERKTLTYRDFADREYTNQISIQNGFDLVLPSIDLIEIGDVLQQAEYLTPFKFNRILAKLDSDAGITDADFYSTLAVDTKAELRDGIDALVAKLNAQIPALGNVYSAGVAVSPSGIQSDFNAIVALLNTDTSLALGDYPESEQTHLLEVKVESIDSANQTVIVNIEFDWDLWDITHYKAIETLVEWSPIHAGNPGVLKQFREANLMFSETLATQTFLAFRSDTYRDFEEVTLNNRGSIGWGLSPWGEAPWGDGIEPGAYRTYVPKYKQRCRYLNPRFRHKRGFEYNHLVGLSITFDAIINRISR